MSNSFAGFSNKFCMLFRNRKRISGPFHPALSMNSQMFAVSMDGRYLYAGGSWDNSLKVISVHRGKAVASITKHLDIITCIALDDCGSYLVTGSQDCTCIVWSLSGDVLSSGISSTNPPTTPNHSSHSNQPITASQTNTQNSQTPRPVNTLYGHDKPITCCAIFTELDLVVSGSEVSIRKYCLDVCFQLVLTSVVRSLGWHSECAYNKKRSLRTNITTGSMYRFID